MPVYQKDVCECECMCPLCLERRNTKPRELLQAAAGGGDMVEGGGGHATGGEVGVAVVVAGEEIGGVNRLSLCSSQRQSSSRSPRRAIAPPTKGGEGSRCLYVWDSRVHRRLPTPRRSLDGRARSTLPRLVQSPNRTRHGALAEKITQRRPWCRPAPA